MLNNPTKPGILQLLAQYHQDPRADKLNLTAGIYTDPSGNSPVLETVREAEYARIQHQRSKATFDMDGAPEFQQAVRRLLFPSGEEGSAHHVQVIQTVGSSGALHLAGRMIQHDAPAARVWISSPTWENHAALLSSRPEQIGYYRYQPADPDQLCMTTILEDLQAARPGDYVLLHACCHNPTGMDPTLSQWREWAEFCAERGLIPLFDFAYQGFAQSAEQDAELFALFREHSDRLIICNSFSKNMGLYNERTGALTLVFKDADRLAVWHSTLKRMIRSTYSTPPAHGAYIASHIINDPHRYSCWQQELKEMRCDLQRRRAALFAELESSGLMDTLLSYHRQQGMFLCLQLSPPSIEVLREQHGIYLLDTGRICIASLPQEAIPAFCLALGQVVEGTNTLSRKA